MWSRMTDFTQLPGDLPVPEDDVISDDAIEHVFYPIFPPNEHAREVLQWLRDAARPSP
jgi:hypothetical protein